MSLKESVTKFWQSHEGATNAEIAKAVKSSPSNIAHIAADLRNPDRVIRHRGGARGVKEASAAVDPLAVIDSRVTAINERLAAMAAEYKTLRAEREALTKAAKEVRKALNIAAK